MEDIAPNVALVLVAALLEYLKLPYEPILILCVIMSLDLITGVAKSLRIQRGITSRRWAVGVLGKLSLLGIPLVIALAAKALGGDFNWLVAWSVSMLILSETYSVIANIHATRSGKELPEWDVVSLMLKKIIELAEKALPNARNE